MKRTLLMALTLLGLATGALAQSERSYDNATVVATYNSENSLSDNLADLNAWLQGGNGDGTTTFFDWLIDNNLDPFFDYEYWVESDPYFDEIFGYRMLRVRAWVFDEFENEYVEIVLDELDDRIVRGILECYFSPSGPGAGRLDPNGGAYGNELGQAEQFPVNDPLYTGGFQRNLQNANFPAAWSSNATGNFGVSIAVVDTGWENGQIFPFVPHGDLSGKVLGEINFTGFGGIFNAVDIDPLSHGTRVAGLAAAETNNLFGMAGAGYDTSLTIIKSGHFTTLSGNVVGGFGVFSTMLGIFWAHTWFGSQIINVSSSYNIPFVFQLLGDVVLNWVTRGNLPGGSGLPPSLVIASSGRTAVDGGAAANVLRWPASRPQVMAVGGTTNVAGKFANGELTEGFLNNSRLGAKVEASAAGRLLNSSENYNFFAAIFSPIITGVPYVGDLSGFTPTAGPTFPNPSPLGADRNQGTSFAAPQVSGLAALLWAFTTNPFDVPSLNINPFNVAAYVKARISRNTDLIQPTAGGRSSAVNTGRINAGRTVAYVDRVNLPTQNVGTARLGTNITARVVLDRAYTTDQTVRIVSSNPGLARPTVTTVKVKAGQLQANVGIAVARQFNAPTLNNRMKVEIYADFRGTRQVGQLYVVR